MEDLIFFLIGIAYVGYRFYKSNLSDNKSPGPAKQSTRNNNYEEHTESMEDHNNTEDRKIGLADNFNDYISNFFQEENVDYKEEDNIDYDIKPEKENSIKSNEIAEDFSIMEGSSDIPDRVLSVKNDQEGNSRSELLKDFNLRKAVIYKEILDRKYF